MLNPLTIRRRAELRRLRAGLLLATLTCIGFGAALLCIGLWIHALPVAACAVPTLPLSRALRMRTLSVSKVLRLLGA